MPINLQDIRNAVISYVDNLPVTISKPTPTTGSEIDHPHEEFSFTITAQNKAIPLRNVIWRVWVENGAVGQLCVPKGMAAWSSLSATSDNKLTTGEFVSEMYLYDPPRLSDVHSSPFLDSINYLGTDDTDSISLKGKGLTKGTSVIQCKVYADIDMDWLFPKSQDSAAASRALQVV
jgi:hypothetical protein